MSDLETRLTRTLRDGADAAPDAVGLAAAARTRARQRRRTRVGGVAVLVALTLGVPAAVVATSGGDGGRSDDTATTATEPDGYRTASWHSVSIEVPDAWQDGGAEDWCAGSVDPRDPRVSRPGVVFSIGCGTQQLGATFQQTDNTDDFRWPIVAESGDEWPVPVFVGGRGIGGVLVTVAAEDEDVVARVLDSMATIGTSGDAHGCTVRPGDPAPAPTDGGMAVCRYDDAGLLEQSELLVREDAERARAAVAAAPPLADTDACRHRDAAGARGILLRSEDFRVTVEVSGDCPTTRGLGEDRQTTPDVSYWALSPGWRGEMNPAAVGDQRR